MIDIVYPLRRAASHVDDAELRYSLRSVAAHLRMEVETLHLVGHQPPWVRGAIHHPASDPGDKALNLLAKYWLMCDAEDISDPFLLLDDDHIFLRETTEIPLHTNGTLADYISEFRQNTYGSYLRNCLALLRARGLPERNYQIHYPMLIDKDTLRRVLDVAGRTKTVMGSLYGNLVDGPTVEITRDYRIRDVSGWAAVRGGPFVALTDRALKSKPIWDEVRALLPTPSPWERT